MKKLVTQARRYWYLILLAAMVACGSSAPSSAPSSVTPPSASPIPTFTALPQTAIPSPTQPTATPSGCKSSEEMTKALRVAAQVEVDSGRAPNWQAPRLLVAKRIEDAGKQFKCKYQVRLWGENYDEFSNTKNLETYSIGDLYSFLATAKTVSSDAYIATFVWKGEDGQKYYEQLEGGFEDLNFSKYFGGILLYTNLSSKSP